MYAHEYWVFGHWKVLNSKKISILGDLFSATLAPHKIDDHAKLMIFALQKLIVCRRGMAPIQISHTFTTILWNTKVLLHFITAFSSTSIYEAGTD